MTEREKWEAGLWYDANFDEELRIEREKAEELYTEFNQTGPSQKPPQAAPTVCSVTRREGVATLLQCVCPEMICTRAYPSNSASRAELSP